MEGGAHGTDVVTEHPRQRNGQGLDHGDLEAQTAAGGRHFGTDESGPHHHHRGRGKSHVGPQRETVLQGP
jgi:hypothetical protein